MQYVPAGGFFGWMAYEGINLFYENETGMIFGIPLCAVIPFKGKTFADAFNLSEKFGFTLGKIGGLVFFALLTATLVFFIRRKDKAKEQK